MRESFQFDVLPIVQDNMHEVFHGVTCLNSITSNGYYGYQPSLGSVKEVIPSKGAHAEQMEVQFEYLPENRPICRKRAWEYATNDSPFKKRRQNEKNSDVKRNLSREDLFEAMLRETHGCTIYHWNSSSDV